MIFDPVNNTGLMERAFSILRRRRMASSECNPDFRVVMLSIVNFLKALPEKCSKALSSQVSSAKMFPKLIKRTNEFWLFTSRVSQSFKWFPGCKSVVGLNCKNIPRGNGFTVQAP